MNNEVNTIFLAALFPTLHLRLVITGMLKFNATSRQKNIFSSFYLLPFQLYSILWCALYVKCLHNEWKWKIYKESMKWNKIPGKCWVAREQIVVDTFLENEIWNVSDRQESKFFVMHIFRLLISHVHQNIGPPFYSCHKIFVQKLFQIQNFAWFCRLGP